MHQVLGNLVGNAVKFTPPGGQVRIRREQGSTFTIAFPAGDAGDVRGPQPAPHNGAKPVEVAG